MTDSPDFAYGAALFPLCGNHFKALLPTLVQQGHVVRRTEDEGWLIAWPGDGNPDSDRGIVSYIAPGRDSAASEFLCAWPFALSGTRHLVAIDTVLTDPASQALRVYGGTIAGVAVRLFDTQCLGGEMGLAPGTGVAARLHGWALSLKRAPLDPIVITREAAGEGLLAAFADTFARDGQLEIHTNELRALIARDADGAPLHEINGPVKAVRPGPVLMGRKLHVLTIAVAICEQDDYEIDLEVTITSETWPGPAPRVGEIVRGVVWLQALFEEGADT